MFIKFNFGKSLINFIIYITAQYLCLGESIIIEKLFNFGDPIIFTFLMALGEIYGGLSVYLFVRNAFRKKKMNYLKLQLYKKRKTRGDGWTKKIILIFFAAFFDFVEFIIYNSYLNQFEKISVTVNIRYSAITTISSTLLCLYALKFKPGRHQIFAMIFIGIFLIIQFLIEIYFSSNNLQFFSLFFLYLLHLILITFTDVIEKYLGDIDFANPFGITMGEGIFTFIMTAIYAIGKNPFGQLKQLYEEFSISKFILLVFLLFLYSFLSAVFNIYKIYCNIYLSPMVRSLFIYYFNPIYIIFSYYYNDDFVYKGEKNLLFFVLNEILSLIFTILGFIYSGNIVIYCCHLEVDTIYDINIRAKNSLNDANMNDIREITKNEEEDIDDSDNDTNE